MGKPFRVDRLTLHYRIIKVILRVQQVQQQHRLEQQQHRQVQPRLQQQTHHPHPQPTTATLPKRQKQKINPPTHDVDGLSGVHWPLPSFCCPFVYSFVAWRVAAAAVDSRATTVPWELWKKSSPTRSTTEAPPTRGPKIPNRNGPWRRKRVTRRRSKVFPPPPPYQR